MDGSWTGEEAQWLARGSAAEAKSRPQSETESACHAAASACGDVSWTGHASQAEGGGVPRRRKDCRGGVDSDAERERVEPKRLERGDAAGRQPLEAVDVVPLAGRREGVVDHHADRLAARLAVEPARWREGGEDWTHRPVQDLAADGAQRRVEQRRREGGVCAGLGRPLRERRHARNLLDRRGGSDHASRQQRPDTVLGGRA